MPVIKPIAKALNEAKSAVLQVALFQSLLDTIVVFFLLLLGCKLLTIPLAYGFIIALIYAIVHTRANLKEVTFAGIESKFPELKEELITVADNWRDNSEIVSALNEEVLQKMHNIKTSAFLNLGKLTREILVMAVIAFILIGTAAWNVKFLDLQQAVHDIRTFKDHGPYDINQDLLKLEESQNLSNILGNKSITELGSKQLDLQINPIMSDVNIGKIKPVEDERFQEVAPREIKATSDVSFEEQIPKQYQRIVKTYFKEITRQ